MKVAIRGTGVAAATCAHLLSAANLRVRRASANRVQVPSIMLSAPALALLRDVFGRPGLFAERPRISRRIVSWGGQEPVSVPHEAIVISEEELARELDPGQWADTSTEPSDFSVLAVPPLPPGEKLVFGNRKAEMRRVILREMNAGDECRTEAVREGWLFLVPDAAGQGWVLGFGAPIEELLEDSRLVAPAIELEQGTSRQLETAPGLHMPLAGQDWLVCGTAALRFDPICGDGTAQAVREAVLASAVIGAIADGGDREALLLHYRSMLVAAMRRHLHLCAGFYATGGQSAWWRAQTDALARGHDLCSRILAGMPEPQFVLQDFALKRRAVAA